MSEKQFMCYGDSNTWGWNPATSDVDGIHLDLSEHRKLGEQLLPA